MFKNTPQDGCVPIFYSIESKPLDIWDKKVRNGSVKRVIDEILQSKVIEILGRPVTRNYITCPRDLQLTLGIKLPYLVMIVKNLIKYFIFDVQVLDDKNVKRRFRMSNLAKHAKLKPLTCIVPLRLKLDWNKVELNLADITRIAYKTKYVETLRVQFHSNCRIRKVYFADRTYNEGELPAELQFEHSLHDIKD